MNKIVLILTLFLLTDPLMSQIVIAPEAGIYHRPYFFRVVSNGVEQEKMDYYVGLMGEVRLMPKLYAQSRINYVFRHNTETGDVWWCFIPSIKDAKLTNKEMNLSVDILYEPIKKSKIGIGLVMIHKLNSHVQENFYFEPSVIKYFNPSIYYAASVVISHNWGRIGISGRYINLFKSEYIDTKNLGIKNDRSGFSVGLNYRLFGYKK